MPSREAERQGRPSMLQQARFRETRLSCLLLPVILAAYAGNLTTPARGEAVVAQSEFPMATYVYFRAMDNGIALAPNEIKGRNTWIIWTAGNDAFWNYLSNHSFG